MERIIINLDTSPSERWNWLKDYKEETNSLLKYYLEDLSSAGIFETYIDTYKMLFISKHYQQEIECVAKHCDFSENQVLITNLYYDALKFVFGCTSFSVTNEDEKLHARNLDWWSENNILGKFTKIFDFKKKDEIEYSLDLVMA